jgi:hypothetical protein
MPGVTPPHHCRRLVVKHLPTEEWLRQTESIESPLIIRSEAEQFIGQEIIKALSTFKQNLTAPLSLHSAMLNNKIINHISLSA